MTKVSAFRHNYLEIVYTCLKMYYDNNLTFQFPSKTRNKNY